MKSLYYFPFLLMLCIANAAAQTLHFGIGPVHTYTNNTVPLVNWKNRLEYLYVQKRIGLDIPLRPRLDLSTALSNYEVSTNMQTDAKNSQGFVGTRVTRLDIGVAYNLLRPGQRFFIKPNFALGMQFARKTSDLWREQFRVYGPEYFQSRLPDSKGQSNFQVVPVAGLSMGLKFLKRCEAGVLIQGIYGYRTFQTLYFYYTHKDSRSVERTAVFESRGTGINSALFLGIRIGPRKEFRK